MKSTFVHIPSFEIKPISQKPFRQGVTLASDLIYWSKITNREWIVSEGFHSDGASVPQFLWNRMPPFGKYLEAAVLHDFFCKCGTKGVIALDYKTAAKVFREAMEVLGVNRYRRNIMYFAVLWFGPKF